MKLMMCVFKSDFFFMVVISSILRVGRILVVSILMCEFLAFPQIDWKFLAAGCSRLPSRTSEKWRGWNSCWGSLIYS